MIIRNAKITNGWITAGMCKSGSNLYIHHIFLGNSQTQVSFSFPSAQASSYNSLQDLIPALGKIFAGNFFSCNGVKTYPKMSILYQAQIFRNSTKISFNYINIEENSTSTFALDISDSSTSVKDIVVPIIAP